MRVPNVHLTTFRDLPASSLECTRSRNYPSTICRTWFPQTNSPLLLKPLLLLFFHSAHLISWVSSFLVAVCSCLRVTDAVLACQAWTISPAAAAVYQSTTLAFLPCDPPAVLADPCVVVEKSAPCSPPEVHAAPAPATMRCHQLEQHHFDWPAELAFWSSDDFFSATETRQMASTLFVHGCMP